MMLSPTLKLLARALVLLLLALSSLGGILTLPGVPALAPVPAAYADDCDNHLPPPFVDGCEPTPTPTPTPPPLSN